MQAVFGVFPFAGEPTTTEGIMRAEQGSLNKTRIVSGRIIKDSGLKQHMKCLNLSGRDKEDGGVSHVGEDSSHGKDGPHLSHLRPSPLTYRPTTKSEPPHAKAAPVPTRGQLPNPRPGIREDSPARGSRILCLRKKLFSDLALPERFSQVWRNSKCRSRRGTTGIASGSSRQGSIHAFLEWI